MNSEIPDPDWELLWMRSEELQRRADKNQRRSTLGVRIAIVGLVLIALAIGAAIPYALNTREDSHILHRLDLSSARTDCRSAINAELQDVKDDRFNVVISTVFEHKPPGTPLTDEENARITQAEALVAALPTLPEAVKKGATINGKLFPACPVVG